MGKFARERWRYACQAHHRADNDYDFSDQRPVAILNQAATHAKRREAYRPESVGRALRARRCPTNAARRGLRALPPRPTSNLTFVVSCLPGFPDSDSD